MVILFDVETRKIYGRFEAWDPDSIDNAYALARKLGAKVVSEEITLLGNMEIGIKF